MTSSLSSLQVLDFSTQNIISGRVMDASREAGLSGGRGDEDSRTTLKGPPVYWDPSIFEFFHASAMLGVAMEIESGTFLRKAEELAYSLIEIIQNHRQSLRKIEKFMINHILNYAYEEVMNIESGLLDGRENKEEKARLRCRKMDFLLKFLPPLLIEERIQGPDNSDIGISLTALYLTFGFDVDSIESLPDRIDLSRILSCPKDLIIEKYGHIFNPLQLYGLETSNLTRRGFFVNPAPFVSQIHLILRTHLSTKATFNSLHSLNKFKCGSLHIRLSANVSKPALRSSQSMPSSEEEANGLAIMKDIIDLLLSQGSLTNPRIIESTLISPRFLALIPFLDTHIILDFSLSLN